jgi:hypothetical protein
MKRLSSFAIIGALALASLTACSSDGDGSTGFCVLSATFGGGKGLALFDLSDTAKRNALAGNLSGVNEWGVSAVASIDEITAQLTSAKESAPTDEIALAIDDVLEGVARMRSFAVFASTVTTFGALMTEAQSLEGELTAVDSSMPAASDLLDAAVVEYCGSREEARPT